VVANEHGESCEHVTDKDHFKQGMANTIRKIAREGPGNGAWGAEEETLS
jgi:hypothetical protein